MQFYYLFFKIIRKKGSISFNFSWIGYPSATKKNMSKKKKKTFQAIKQRNNI